MKRQGRGRKKERFIRRFRKRFLLRFHMSLILTATCLSGTLFSKLLLFLSVREPLIRYPLTATLSYLLFFLFIKLWLWYVSTTGQQKAADTVDAVMEMGDVVGFACLLSAGDEDCGSDLTVGGALIQTIVNIPALTFE